MPTPTPHPLLDLELDPKDNLARATTVRGYLAAVLGRFWATRKTGTSNWHHWEHELFIPMIRAGLVDGVADSTGYVEMLDRPAAETLVADAIAALGEPSAQGGVTPQQHARHAALDLAVAVLRGTVRLLDKEQGEDPYGEALAGAVRFAAFIEHGTVEGRPVEAVLVAAEASAEPPVGSHRAFVPGFPSAAPVVDEPVEAPEQPATVVADAARLDAALWDGRGWPRTWRTR